MRNNAYLCYHYGLVYRIARGKAIRMLSKVAAGESGINPDAYGKVIGTIDFKFPDTVSDARFILASLANIRNKDK